MTAATGGLVAKGNPKKITSLDAPRNLRQHTQGGLKRCEGGL
jgi:hypothetical protein